MDLETFEESVPEPLRDPLAEARSILMRQADILEALNMDAKGTTAHRPRRSTAAKRSRRSA